MMGRVRIILGVLHLLKALFVLAVFIVGCVFIAHVNDIGGGLALKTSLDPHCKIIILPQSHTYKILHTYKDYSSWMLRSKTVGPKAMGNPEDILQLGGSVRVLDKECDIIMTQTMNYREYAVHIISPGNVSRSLIPQCLPDTNPGQEIAFLAERDVDWSIKAFPLTIWFLHNFICAMVQLKMEVEGSIDSANSLIVGGFAAFVAIVSLNMLYFMNGIQHTDECPQIIEMTYDNELAGELEAYLVFLSLAPCMGCCFVACAAENCGVTDRTPLVVLAIGIEVLAFMIWNIGVWVWRVITAGVWLFFDLNFTVYLGWQDLQVGVDLAWVNIFLFSVFFVNVLSLVATVGGCYMKLNP